LYPEYFFHPVVYSNFYLISAPKPRTGMIVKDLNNFKVSNENEQRVNVFNTEHKHLKRIFNDLEVPENNLILLLEDKELDSIHLTQEDLHSELKNHLKDIDIKIKV
jgi:hypothetical protein